MDTPHHILYVDHSVADDERLPADPHGSSHVLCQDCECIPYTHDEVIRGLAFNTSMAKIYAFAEADDHCEECLGLILVGIKELIEDDFGQWLSDWLTGSG